MATTVIITTRNRSAELERTLRVLSGMDPQPDEVLVTADGCSDDTAEMIRREFPDVKLTVNLACQGSVPSRDRMIRCACHELVMSLDDDSYPLDLKFFGKVPTLFASHPEAAVITFPELRDDGEFASPVKSPTTAGHYASAYPNCAAAMRREFYLQCPGFPEFFEHMYEEPDFALQCYARGSAVWFEPSLTIRHHLSRAERQPIRRHHQNARNELWSVWMRCPWPWLPLVSAFRLWRQFRYAWSEGWDWAIREPYWWLSALRGLSACWHARRSVPWTVYSQWMKLARNPQALLPIEPLAKPALAGA